MTFSLVARCARTGRFGMAIASSSPAVAARCAHVRAGVGAAASQNVTDPALGVDLLDRLAEGLTAPEALDRVVRDRVHIDWRQLLVVDAAGRVAIHSGRRTLGLGAEAAARDCAAAGNLLADAGVPQAMVGAFAASDGDLADRLMAGLAAGLAAGGEAGPVHSAGLKLADRLSWPFVDLRVDWSDTPVADLGDLWQLYRPQADSYVQRAENPDAAPSFGVAGDR
jgi:uncharacterized Ntn-hydrolase superfamily protein